MNWDQFVAICRSLNVAGVRYVLVGGFAIVLHGYERTTQDVDFLVDVSEDNIAKLKEGLRLLFPEACDELQPHDVAGYTVVRMGGDEMVVDLMRSIGEIDYERAMQDCEQMQIDDDLTIPVAGLETMILLKQGLRGKDQDDRLFLEGKQRYLHAHATDRSTK